MSQKSCLVIGANGFIGSHLVDALCKKGYFVKAFDRYTHAPQFTENKTVEVVKGDFFDDIVLGEAMKGVDYVFHTFSATTPFISDADPYKDISLNVLRNVQIFEKAVESNVKKIMYLSSGGAVYGHMAEQKNVTEDDAPMPVSPYGIGKLASEYYLEYFNRKYGLEYLAYRVTNPYGPRQIMKNSQGVIPAFLEKISKGEKLSIIGDGNSTRDYIYIEDAVNMIVDSFENKTKYRIYNTGSGIQTSVNDIVKTLEANLGIEAKLEYMEAPKTFLTKSQINVDRFTDEFHLGAKTTLSEGIRLLLKDAKI